MNLRLRCMLALLIVTFVAEAFAAQGERASSGKVVQVSETPTARSGVIQAWVEIRLDSSTRAPATPMFLLYLSAKQGIPAVGQYCTFRTHIEMVRGFVGRNMPPPKKSAVIDDFECSAEQ